MTKYVLIPNFVKIGPRFGHRQYTLNGDHSRIHFFRLKGSQGYIFKNSTSIGLAQNLFGLNEKIKLKNFQLINLQSYISTIFKTHFIFHGNLIMS